MAIDRVRYKPRDALWVSVEVTIEYSCDAAPRVEKRIRGLKKFAFIVGHEYDIDVKVEDYRRDSCECSGCKHSVQYDCDILVLVSDSIGIGFGLGSHGTAVAGWDFEASEERWKHKTSCICCDDRFDELRSIEIAKSPHRQDLEGLTLIAWLVAICSGVVISASHSGILDHVAKAFLWFISCAMVATLLIAIGRLLLLVRRRARHRHTEDQKQLIE